MSPADRAAQYDRLAQIIAEAITRAAYGQAHQARDQDEIPWRDRTPAQQEEANRRGDARAWQRTRP